jgi:hypothetical protein
MTRLFCVPVHKRQANIPIGRAIIHRPTGRIVGPIAPISPDDWPFQEVPDSETLWRYMDLRKFDDVLRTSTLYFSRPDKFTDPFEGRFSPGNADKISKSDETFRSLYKIDDSKTRGYSELHLKLVFISCWHRNTRESFEMWRAYTSSSDSVVIATSAKALRRFLPQEIMKYAVKYAPLDFPRTEFSHNALFYYKPSPYSIEREYRLLRSPGENEAFYPDNPEDWFRRVPIRTKKIVHRVITHPYATRETKAKVEELLKRYLPCRRRENSALEI